MSSKDNRNLDNQEKGNLEIDARASISPPKTARDDAFSYKPDGRGNDMTNQLPAQVDNTRLSHYQTTTLSTQQEDNLIKFNHLTYLLYMLSFFTAGLIWIVPIVMNYMRRREADNTWLATHFDWQIKTFWYSLILGGIGLSLIIFSFGGLGVSAIASSTNGALGSLLLMGLGGLLLMIAVLWHFYRIIRGWIALSDKRPIP